MDINEKTFQTLEYDKILNQLAGFAKTTQSKSYCLDLKPFDNWSKISQEIAFTTEAKNILDIPSDIPIDFVADMKSIRVHSTSSYLSEQELVDVAKTLRSSRLVKNFISNNGEILLKGLSSRLVSNKELEDKIFSVFDDELKIKKDATPELKKLFTALKDTEKILKSKVADLLNSADFTKHLQETIYTTRDDRIVFQVKTTSKSKIKGIVHDVSATNKTLYVEPEAIVPINNKIREITSEINAEYVKILAELTGLVKFEMKDLIASEEALTMIDFHFAKARYAVKIHATQPELVKEKILEFENMKHPLLIGTVDNVVTNNFSIGKEYKSVVITGSNTGGKTVTLKTIGLFILMTKSGMFLPCTMAKIYPFSKVFSDIGDYQNILQSLSTFSSHMTNIIEITRLADDDTFVLLDEICAGTDPQEGAILAKSILEFLAQKNTLCTVTTHYGELKTLEYINPYFKNASVEFDTKSLKPTYKLNIGIPGMSNAISIASNLGLDPTIIEQCKNSLNSDKSPTSVAVERLQQTQEKLTKNLQKAEELSEESENIKKEYEENLAQVKSDKKKTVKKIKEKFDYELLSVKAEIKEILDELRKEKSEKIARRSYARLAKINQDFREKISDYEEQTTYKDIDWGKISINDKLILKEIHQPVVLLTLPDKNNKVLVQIGNIKSKVDKKKLAPYDKAYEVNSKTYTPSFEKFEMKKINLSNRFDIRGYRVQDALDELEIYLDKASLANLSPVTIIHGHGTGTLKQAVRDYLSTSPYVAKFRPGSDGEGGDGVSVIDIK